MSDKKCCVPGCSCPEELAVLHRFPNPEKDRERFNAWLMAIGGDILALENDHIWKYRRVCNIHFEAKYYCRNKRISKSAVPTLNLPGPLSVPQFSLGERRPLRDIQNLEEPSTSREPVATVQISNPPFAVEESEVVPSSSVSQLVNEPASKQDELVTSVEPTNLPITVEELQVVPSSFELKHINKSTTKHHEPKKPWTTGEKMDPAQSTHLQDNRKATHKKRGKRTLKKCLPPLTSKEKALKTKIIALQIKVSKLKNKTKKQMAELKAARNLTTNPDVRKVLESCSSTAKLFFEMQWRENKKKQQGRRFTLEEKIFALSIFKQSPKAYRFFRKIFLLPAPQTLTKLVQKANIQAGINKNVFQQLKTKAEAMKHQEKLCVLLFDEVSLKPNLSYNERKDRVTGFVDNGEEIKPEFANHAQVFMVRGLIKNYKQPVAYTFSASATKGPELSKQIKRVIIELQKAGLIVVATVCDQGTNNRQALKLLVSEARGIYLRRGERPQNNIMLINDQEIVPLYDPPHLLKGMRNNLLTKDLKYIKDGLTKVAKWSHIKRIYEESPGYRGIRLIPKLSGNHVYPERMNKMKVKYASQIFSKTVASNMGYLADKGIIEPACKDTADLLILMDDLFDSVNGSATKNKHAKPLLGPASLNSVHMKTWHEIKKVLSTMKFVTASQRQEPVPTIGNWIWTIDGMEVLLKKLNNEFNITSVWLRHLNQDPLENFFGAIRSHGCRNVNPSCDQFESAYVSLLINNLSSVHSHGRNCEEDFSRALHALVIDNNPEATSSCSINLTDIIDINLTALELKKSIPSVIAPLQYVSGYVLKKTQTNIFKNCIVCKSDLMNSEETEYIKYREYAGRRWLCSPSEKLLQLISDCQDIANHILKAQLEKKYLKESLKTAIYTITDFDWLNCETHKNETAKYIVNLFTRFIIYSHCKNINKIIAGRREVDDVGDMFQIKAHNVSGTYKKCNKNK